ncbi:uncharacterized protein LOC105182519 [Harpegnathos saltator]|uniref:uncharacterized protein LOC105182519 n=1 Tax=Harpegnathos saltator TaxID=610380 RepID=UPI00058CA6BB|nr:uncharacterized protein LOC105182519 [Harpegnathos saltator]
MAVASVVGTIGDLGLRVAPQKTEAVFFLDGSRGAPPEKRVLVDGVHIRVGPTIKQLAPSVREAGLALASLLRNHGGPGWRSRRLYVSAVLSIALYGASIWAPQLRASRDGIRRLRAALRPLYVRAARGFRTLSYMAATTLAGSPPVELIAEERALLYSRVKELREAGEQSPPWTPPCRGGGACMPL